MSRHFFINAQGEEISKSPSSDGIAGVAYAFPEIDEVVKVDFIQLDRAVQTAGMCFGLHTRANNMVNSAMHKVKDQGDVEKAAAGHEALEALLEDWSDGRWGAERGDGLGRLSDFIEALARYRTSKGVETDDEWRNARRTEVRALDDDGKKKFMKDRLDSQHGAGIRLELEGIKQEKADARKARLATAAASANVSAEDVADL